MISKNDKRICIVIPAYNESATIADVVKRVKRVFQKCSFETDIVVVDDGSTDATAKAAHKEGAIVISHILNSGAGGATGTGLRYARKRNYDIAATMDADGQHAAEDVLRGVEKVKESGDVDLLIGSRLINSRGMSRVKVLGNKGLSFITYLLFGIRTTDSQSGMRILSTRALEKLYWKTNGYEFCSEILWRASQLKLKVAEYPIQAIYTEYSKAKGQNNWNAINIVRALVWRRVVEIFG
ncbi:MAG TPA: glycosyltransferase family 2 protein [Candidatus Babeliaceae bacterium]|nr:glycosyltransferase family 2 protein [Candidatus Babeliaceae bacterium]